MSSSVQPPPMASTQPGVVSWYGPGILLCISPPVHDHGAIRAYYASIVRALDEGTGPYVMVTDTRHLRTIPDANARRLHSELSCATIDAHPRPCTRSITIVQSPAVRAVLTAVRWMIVGGTVPSEVVATFDDAIRAARARG